MNNGKQRTLHVLGGALWQVPTIRRAKELGYRVLVTDMYQERPGYEFADAHAVVDLKDIEGTLKIAREYGIDGILCDCTDVGVPTAAAVAEQLGLPGIGTEIALNFTDKSRMRALSARAGVPNPKFRLVKDLTELRKAAVEIGFPVAVKPADSQASRGVLRVDSTQMLEHALSFARANTRKDSVIVEKWIDGIEVTVESVVENGVVQVLGISDKDHFRDAPQIASRLTYPADFPAAILERLSTTNRRVISALGLKHGITHAEYLVETGPESEVYLVEIAARGGGSRIHSMIAPYLSDFPVLDFVIESAMGQAPRVPKINTAGKSANLFFFDFPSGVVAAIEGMEEATRLPGVAELRLEFRVGDFLGKIDNDRARPGYGIVFGRDRSEVLRTSEEIRRRVQVRISSD